MFDLKDKKLQHIFNKELAELLKSFEALRKTVDEVTFKHDVMLCFWVAIHYDCFEEAKLIYGQDKICT